MFQYYLLYNVGDFLVIKDLAYNNPAIKKFSKDGLLFGHGDVVDQSENYVPISGIKR